MDHFSKKRKPDENGAPAASPASGAAALGLTRDDVLRLLEPLSRDQLADIAAAAALVSAAALDAVRAAADRDPALRKLFVRGLGWETTSDSLSAIFSAYGDLEEAVVITDKSTGRSKGYGFVTFRHADSAVLALKEPSKKIDGRMTVTQLAAAGAAGGPSGGAAGSGGAPVADVSLRKIFVGNVPADMPSERLLAHFAAYGEIEEGPLGFDKQTGKFRGFALFVYKTPEGAQASLVDSVKVIDGHQLVCKLAIEGKKGKQGQPQQSGPASQQQQQMLQGGPQDMPGSGLGGSQMGAQYGGPGSGMSSFGAFGGVGGGFGGPNPYGNLPSSMGGGGAGAGLGSLGGQMPGGLGAAGAGAYGAGGLGGGSFRGSSQFGAPGMGAYGGLGMGGASSMYRMQQGAGGLPSGGYGDGGNYPLPGAGFRGQDPQAGMSPGPVGRVPPMYPNVPPYF
ncbi:UBP1-associated protein 2C-like [Phragmites australis]|uniref:UBP1-associated protein 2C-like n=1 Tax=Phragmites australis TaxID=29695 RepID=UPI002D7995EB|nr:UBP1-associated protein 2C-like [Phragmites australis]XP_062205220.1 UBP1-associated protein 2C-like [Phragmites australis]XP_062205223.1 UBP1-associated protein 2C-like [Phragmites australis]XP_062205230.1 UBP1-associated protein 2C-like [Phragmites australis]